MLGMSPCISPKVLSSVTIYFSFSSSNKYIQNCSVILFNAYDYYYSYYYSLLNCETTCRSLSHVTDLTTLAAKLAVLR